MNWIYGNKYVTYIRLLYIKNKHSKNGGFY